MLQHTNTTVALAGLDADEKAKNFLGSRAVNYVSESGLYTLVMRSTLPVAKTFRKWVTSEVLPAIRRNGGYMTPEVAVMATESPAVFLARSIAFYEY